MSGLLEVVGIGLAVPGVIEIVVRAGLEIERRVSNARHLEIHIARYRTIGTSLARGQLRTQLELVKTACDNVTLPEELKVQLNSSFEKIIECLVNAEKELAEAESHVTKGKFKVLFGRRLGFESRIQELEGQQDIFMTLANLVHLQQSAPSVSFLANRIKLRHESEENPAKYQLPNSNISIAQYDARGMTKEVIVESRPYTKHSILEVEDTVKSLTRLLCRDRFVQSIPPCMGYRKNPFHDAYEVIFEMPQSSHRRTLADMLARVAPPPPLEQRVLLCKLLAQAVSDVHSMGLVHKSIRPSSILIMDRSHEQGSTQVLYLTDWTLVRAVDQSSYLQGEHYWQRAIYQHPTRQGLRAGSRYSIKHDCYSLGVCMLEILLWQPLVVGSSSDVANSPKEISEHFQNRAIALGDEKGVPARYFANTQKMTSKPSVVQRVLLDLCRTEVPVCAGSKLTGLVNDCLRCLENSEASPEQQNDADEDLESGLNYVEDVLVVLSSICI
jgi:hypothetical protein